MAIMGDQKLPESKPIVKYVWGGNQGFDPWEWVVIILIGLSIGAAIRSCLPKSVHAAEPCFPCLVANIQYCDAKGCVVLCSNGKSGLAKFPVEWSKIVEACP